MYASCNHVATGDAQTLADAKEYADDLLAAGAAPTGAAGGDLSGTYPNPTLKTAAVVDAVEAGIAADTGAQAAIAAAIVDDLTASQAFKDAVAANAPKLKSCANVDHAAGAQVPTCAEMNAAIADAVGSATIPDATDTVKGKVSLATAANLPSTSDTEAATPAYVAAAIAAAPAAAPTGTQVAAAVAGDTAAQASLAASLADDLGATAAETIAGTVTDKFISPDDLKAALQASAEYPIDVTATSGKAAITATKGAGTWAAYYNGNAYVSDFIMVEGNPYLSSTPVGAVYGGYPTIGRNTDGYVSNFLRSGTQVGNIAVTTTGATYNSVSDYRLKTVDGALTTSGKFIDALKPYVGEWKAEPGKKAAFLIAHEAQAVSPSSVQGVKDAVDDKGNPVMQSMDYSSPEIMTNVLAELQSLRKRVAELEAKA